jgi:hypothetical protein
MRIYKDTNKDGEIILKEWKEGPSVTDAEHDDGKTKAILGFTEQSQQHNPTKFMATI